MPIKIFLIGDHEIIRSGLKSLLNAEPDIVVIGESPSCSNAFNKLELEIPDILLIDIHLSIINELEITRNIKHQYPALKIILLPRFNHQTYLLDMLQTSLNGYLLKISSKDELIRTIQKIASGEITINTKKTEVFSQHPLNTEFATQINLTKREKDVLDLIAEGLTNAEIAGKLGTSVRTIETRRKSILRKTGTKNTATLIRFAVQSNLIR